FGMFFVAGLEHDRHGVPHHRPHLRHEVAGFLDVKAVPAGVVFRELLPAVVDGGSIPAFELEEFGVSQARAVWSRHGSAVSWVSWSATFGGVLLHGSSAPPPRSGL